MSRRVVLTAAAVLLAACGPVDPVSKGPLPKVPVALVPGSLEGGVLAVVENDADSTKKLFAGGDRELLVADGRLWEIRDGQKLIGTLQVSTLRPEASPRDDDVRDSVVNGLMPDARREINVADVLVHATATTDKFVYLWFGQTLFQVLQLKGTTIDPERILIEIVEFQLALENRGGLLEYEEAEA